MENKSKPYFQNLDALRFIAAMMVVSSHLTMVSDLPETGFGKYVRAFLSVDGIGGEAGVSFFFVLSGFLITYLMCWESSPHGTFSVKDFYIRRVLRIWPLYFLMVFIGFVVYPPFNPFHEFGQSNVWIYITFLANFVYLTDSGTPWPVVGPLWSISVEEQFYFFWPLIFVLTGLGKKLPWVFGIALAVSSLFIAAGGSKYHTLYALNDLTIGAATAYVSFFYQERVRAFWVRLGGVRAVAIYCLGTLLLFLNYQLDTHFRLYHIFDQQLNALFFAFVISEQSFSPCSLFKLGSVKWLGHLGKISYGVYVYHAAVMWIVFAAGRCMGWPFYLNAVFAIALTLLISEFSYRYFESYFLRLKERFITT